MHVSASRVAVALASVAIVVTACGGGSGGSDKAKTATSAADLGGIDKLVEAAKAEGTLNVIALPPDWANYGAIIDGFSKKYGIKVVSAQPDGSSADEITAAKNNKGTADAPDVFDLGTAVALANVDMFAKYKVANWAEIPDNLKDPNGAWVNDYAGYMSIGCDTSKVATPTTVAEMLDPKYKGMIALNGDPTQASAGFNGVMMASLANGGSADDIAPGVAFFQQLYEAGNLLPVDPNPATIKSGQTPCVIDWLYNNAAQTVALKDTLDFVVTIPEDAPPVAAFYIQAINADAPHPAAARLWQEYLYSPEGSNGWLKGFAMPATIDAMIKNGTADAEAMKAIPTTLQAPVVLTPEQTTKAQDYLKANWNFVTIQ